MLKREKIGELMLRAGFDAWGVVRAAEFSDAKARFEEWLMGGNAYRLDYLGRNVDKRFSPALLHEGTKSVIVGAVSYKNRHSEGYEEGFDARVASYALSRDYHNSLREMLREVALGLGYTEPRSVKVCVDSAPLAEKTLARLAGIGWVGRNSLIVSPSLGSFMVLGELLVPDECDEYSEPYEGNGCVGCGRCLLRCPTGAIRPQGGINTALCISNRTVEQASDEPFGTHGWLFGCDECQTCCPHNESSPLYRNPRFEPTFSPLDFDAEFWATLTPEEAESRFGTTPLMRRFKK
jgi:epoxyqueuosine reductase